MRTKMIVTLGPSTTEEVIRGFVEMGVRGFRINSAHGDESEWRRYIEIVRSICDECAVIVDLRGPRMRIKARREVALSPGDRIVFSRDGDVGVDKEEFFRYVEVGDQILMDDGRLRLLIVNVGYGRVVAQALDPGLIRDNKGLVIKGKEPPIDILDERDEATLGFAREFADVVGASYVRDGKDLSRIRAYAGHLWVMSKVETKSAVGNIDSIIEHSDMVMVARGDLGINFDLAEIPRIQSEIVSRSIGRGRPVYVATQLLTSMAENPMPTRSEIVDIMTAVEQGVDGLVLTNETAVGKYPLEAVRWLKKAISKVDRVFRAEREAESLEDRFTMGIVELAEALGVPVYIYTKSGLTALRIARYRPRVEVVVGTGRAVARKLSLVWGLEPKLLEAKDHREGLEKLEKTVPRGPVLLTYGLYYPEREHIIKLVVRG